MAEIQREKLVNMLAAGFKNNQIADAFSVTPSAVTQAIESDPTIAEEVLARSKYKMMDDTYDEAEAIALKKLKGVLQFEQNPMKLAACVKILNGARRRTSDNHTQETAQTQIVQLNLPQRFQGSLTIQTDRNNEVIEVGSRPLIPMSAEQLQREVKERRALLEHERETSIKDII